MCVVCLCGGGVHACVRACVRTYERASVRVLLKIQLSVCQHLSEWQGHTCDWICVYTYLSIYLFHSLSECSCQVRTAFSLLVFIRYLSKTDNPIFFLGI